MQSKSANTKQLKAAMRSGKLLFYKQWSVRMLPSGVRPRCDYKELVSSQAFVSVSQKKRDEKEQKRRRLETGGGAYCSREQEEGLKALGLPTKLGFRFSQFLDWRKETVEQPVYRVNHSVNFQKST